MTEKKIGKRKVKVHRMEGLYPYVRLEDFMQVCKGLEEENETLRNTNGELQRWLKQTEDMLKFQQEENKKLKEECEENDYLVEDNARWIRECGEKTMEIKKLKEESKKFNKLKIRVYKNLPGDMWEEYQKFCEKNHI